MRWYLPPGDKISPYRGMMRGLWGSFTIAAASAAIAQVCSPRDTVSPGPGPTEALRPCPYPGRMNQLGGKQQNRNAAFWLVSDRASLGGPQLLQPMAVLEKPGIRSLIPQRILFFLASHRFLFRKGPSSN